MLQRQITSPLADSVPPGNTSASVHAQKRDVTAVSITSAT